MTAALELVDVSKQYGGGGPPWNRRPGTLALDRVTIRVDVGSRACLLGPNGAGKSTTIRLALGAIGPTTGRVALLGASADGPGYLEARRRTGVVPQGPGMYPDLTCLEYLELARRLYDRGDVGATAETFGLTPYLSRPMAVLSGGFQRRIVLAAALLAEPDLLLLDEPTVGLDPVATHEIHAALRRAMAGRTTLLCTHNLIEAEALCDDVVILVGGHVRVHESLAALRGRARPGLRLSARGPTARLEDALIRRGFAPHPAVDGSDARVVDVDDPEHAAPDILRALLADDVDVYACQPQRATLESLFLDVVRQS